MTPQAPGDPAGDPADPAVDQPLPRPAGATTRSTRWPEEDGHSYAVRSPRRPIGAVGVVAVAVGLLVGVGVLVALTLL